MDKLFDRKIGFIAWERFGYGGISRVVSGLVNHLAQTNEVSVLCLKDEKFFQNVYGIDTQKVKFTFMELSFIGKLRREFANRNFVRLAKLGPIFIKNFHLIKYPDSYLRKISAWIIENHLELVIFSTGFEDSLQLAAIKPMIPKNVKLVTWSHGCFPDYFRFDSSKKYFESLWKYYYKRFDAIVVLSDSDVRDCHRILGLKATRIYNPNSFTPSGRTTLTNKSFIYVGALSETKGSDILIEAFIEFAKSNNEWSLNIYGEGSISEWMKDRISVSGLQDRVNINPYTDNVRDVYCHNDVFILPSRFEGFGIVQIEAASCGLPIIATELPVTKEIVARRGLGRLFKRLDHHDLATQMLYMANENLRTYSDNCINSSVDFTMDRIMAEWEMLLYHTIRK